MLKRIPNSARSAVIRGGKEDFLATIMCRGARGQGNRMAPMIKRTPVRADDRASIYKDVWGSVPKSIVNAGCPGVSFQNMRLLGGPSAST
ncbi:hypothetical protein A2V61_01025 [Candidatus Woesebacteria bacterium RBG_19FT_COMBO_47_8]|nr:MAG: hypothetical protein A2V61_01025 [Candidatus Woesebacteria bacterium RBG_19FT_COMBO_47_8]